MEPESPSTPVLVLADRDASLRATTAKGLRGAGYQVEEVADLTACHEAITRLRPRIVIVHAQLVDEPALDVCRDILGLPEAVEASLFLAIDADGPDEDFDALDALGVRGFVHRPAHPSLLRHVLQRVQPLPDECSLPAARAVEDGGMLEPAELLARLRDRMPLARSEGTHIAIFGMFLDDAGERQRDQERSPDASRVLADAISGRVREALETSEHDALAALASNLRVACWDAHAIVLVVSGLERVQEAARIGNLILASLVDLTDADGAPLPSNVYVGISNFPEDGVEPATLVDSALDAARRARQNGRDQLVFHTESMGRWAFERLTLEKSLRDAIENRELRVFYQPRIDIQTRKIVGMEGLVRWQHPQFGLVSPAQFIPLAEETGLIVPIGEWVLREACRQNQEWRSKGLPDVRVSVNLSPVQFRKPDLYDTVLSALEDAELPHDGLELEVTESMLMNDPKATAAILHQFRNAGIHISIDDFGTGYSSLSYLKRFPIDALKIDRSFINEVTTNPDDAAIATAIILMGHSLKLTVVAEGVETESQLGFLQVLKCNEIQGFLFSPPVPAEQAEKLIARDLPESEAA